MPSVCVHCLHGLPQQGVGHVESDARDNCLLANGESVKSDNARKQERASTGRPTLVMCLVPRRQLPCHHQAQQHHNTSATASVLMTLQS